MSRKIGIIQPGRIGDIIICLPIALFYRDLGHEVVWPISSDMISNFLSYERSWEGIKFILCNFDVSHAREICKKEKCDRILDLSFNIPGADPRLTNEYKTQNLYSFDEFKYFLAQVPFDNKWNFKIERNLDREKVLESKINITDQYHVVQLSSSDFNVATKALPPNSLHIINITDSIFDWIGVLEKASSHFLIESCFSNLIDQLGIQVINQNLILKTGYYQSPLKDGRLRGMPVLKLPWNIIIPK